MNIAFKLLEEEDLGVLHKWLNKPHVREWYGYEHDYANYSAVVERYLHKTKPGCLTASYIIYIDDNSVGYIQTYLIKDYPDYNKYVKAEDHVAGLDVFIGEEDYLHKGYSSEVMKKFIDTHVFSDNKVKSIIIGPEPKNAAAIKAYSKVGFEYIKTIKVPDEKEPEYLMLLDRKNFNTG